MRMDFLKTITLTITPKLFRSNFKVCSYLSDEPTLANGPPTESSIDALNTATPNLAYKPTLANGPPK